MRESTVAFIFLNLVGGAVVNSMGVDVYSNLVYAVKEPQEGKCANPQQLGLLGVNPDALELRNSEGIDFVYGCTVGVGCLRSGASFEGKDKVDKFAADFGFGKPEFFSAMHGDIDADDYYSLDKMKFKEIFGESFEEDEKS